ncbi:MAG: efflux RND transporter periplasmic adaptor subunit [Pseudohongiellaceae bacterium]
MAFTPQGFTVKFVLRHPLLIVLVAAAASLSYLVYAKVNESASGGPGFGGFGGSPLVGVTTAAEAVIADEVESVGTTVANESVDVTSAVSDTVSRIAFEDGAYVEEGEILVELTSVSESTRLAEAQATVDEAERQFDRLQGLSADRLVAGSELDTARTARQTAQARLEGVMADLEDRLVRAPFSGYLGFRNVSPGSLLTPGTVITTLDDVSVMNLDFRIPEVYLADIQTGQSIAARSIVYADRDFEGRINVIGSRIDPVTRSVSVRAEIDNPDRLLRPGMLMTVALELNEERALVVPERSVIAAQGQQYVYVVGAENRIERRSVSVGRRRDGLVEITSGLEAGERVVSEGTIRVRPGLTVRIEGEEPASGSGGWGGSGRPGASS